MNKETLQIITELSQKLGTTAEYLWATLLKQAPISGMFDAFLSAGCLAAAGIIAYFGGKYVINLKAKEGDCYLPEWPIVLFVVGGASIFLAILSIASAYDAITAFANPEYWALKQIIK